jgi:hypothetical protein
MICQNIGIECQVLMEFLAKHHEPKEHIINIDSALNACRRAQAASVIGCGISEVLPPPFTRLNIAEANYA